MTAAARAFEPVRLFFWGQHTVHGAANRRFPVQKSIDGGGFLC